MSFKSIENDEEIVSEINITPLTDIFLVLLIIFMISSSAILENGLQVKLPTAETADPNKSENNKPTYVTITQDGRIQINNKFIDESRLGSVLKQSIVQSNDKTVIIRGDKSIMLGKAVHIMDLARSSGALKIAIATQMKN